MAILEFPSRLALLAKAWGLQPTSGAFVSAMSTTTKDQLGKYASGQTKSLKGANTNSSLVNDLAKYLDDKDYLSRHDMTKSDFISVFNSADDLEFLQLLERGAPVPNSVKRTSKRDVNSLIPKMSGYSFLYRLGTDSYREQTSDAGNYSVVTKDVLRRIPVRILDDPERNYLTYEDRYSWYGEQPDPNTAFDPGSAHGFVFWTRSSVCIFAEDLDDRQRADLFMIQINMNQVVQNEPVRQGVIVMNGDNGAPTACKVILRKAPEKYDEMDWQDFSRLAELRVPIHDRNRDGYYEIDDPDLPDEEQFDNERLGSLKLADYANRLQVWEHKLHITLGDRGDY